MKILLLTVSFILLLSSCKKEDCERYHYGTIVFLGAGLTEDVNVYVNGEKKGVLVKGMILRVDVLPKQNKWQTYSQSPDSVMLREGLTTVIICETREVSAH